VTRAVVDASVAAKWCLPADYEPFTRQAENLLGSYQNGEVDLFVPDLFWPELANVLWKGVWKGKTDLVRAETAYSKVAQLEMPTIPSRDLAPKALQLAIQHQRTVYDCIYIALALVSDADLITADERLANALAARLPVKWLGAIDLLL
jgi:predicted nucleic acid-binding protein